jgi:hypothetical protein
LTIIEKLAASVRRWAYRATVNAQIGLPSHIRPSKSRLILEAADHRGCKIPSRLLPVDAPLLVARLKKRTDIQWYCLVMQFVDVAQAVQHQLQYGTIASNASHSFEFCNLFTSRRLWTRQLRQKIQSWIASWVVVERVFMGFFLI